MIQAVLFEECGMTMHTLKNINLEADFFFEGS